MKYKIEWDKKAVKELEKLPNNIINNILSRVSVLKEDPFHKKLIGSDSSYRLRVSDYRVIYEVITDEKLIIIYRVRHRKNVYK